MPGLVPLLSGRTNLVVCFMRSTTLSRHGRACPDHPRLTFSFSDATDLRLASGKGVDRWDKPDDDDQKWCDRANLLRWRLLAEFYRTAVGLSRASTAARVSARCGGRVSTARFACFRGWPQQVRP